MKYYIYALNTNNETFYIGVTKDPQRRYLEHVRGGSDPFSTELKYKFISELNSINQKWTLDVIAEYNDNDYNYEDWHIYEALKSGAKLTNMKKGSVYDEVENTMTERFSTPQAFFTKREELLQKASQRKSLCLDKYKKREYSFEDTTFIDDVQSKLNTESSGLAAIRERLNKKVSKH